MSRAASDNGNNPPVVANFIKKLWRIVETLENNEVIAWSDDGKTLIVKNEVEFSKILPRYFKHNNFISFVRQLNLYGFHKVSSDHGGLIRGNTEPQFYSHPHFRRGHPEELHLVQRKAQVRPGPVVESNVSTSLVRSENPQRLSEVMTDIHIMKGRQESIASVLDALKQDNTHLRHEITVLKDKHVRQQKILNKIVHFLVHMVYSKGKIPPTAAARRPTRSTPLMLMDSEDGQLLPPSKKLRMATDSGLSDDATLFDLEGITAFTDQNMPLLSSSADIMNLPSPDSVNSPLPIAPAAVDIQQQDSMALQPFTSGRASNITTVALPTSPASNTMAPEQRSPSSSALSPSLSTGPPSASSNPPSSSSGPLSALNSDNFSSSLPSTAASSSSLLPALPTFLTSALPPSLSSTVLASSSDFPIPTNLLEEHPISAAPSSLSHAPHPENRMCLNGQISHQQVCIDNLQDIIGNFVMDPAVFSEYMSSPEGQEYDADMATIFESVALPNINDIDEEVDSHII